MKWARMKSVRSGAKSPDCWQPAAGRERCATGSRACPSLQGGIAKSFPPVCQRHLKPEKRLQGAFSVAEWCLNLKTHPGLYFPSTQAVQHKEEPQNYTGEREAARSEHRHLTGQKSAFCSRHRAALQGMHVPKCMSTYWVSPLSNGASPFHEQQLSPLGHGSISGAGEEMGSPGEVPQTRRKG